MLEDSPPHPHAGPKYIPKGRKADTSRLEWRTLLALGTSGGLVPCPDAIAILILGSSARQTLFRFAADFCIQSGHLCRSDGGGVECSAGEKSYLSRYKGFENLLPYAPLVKLADRASAGPCFAGQFAEQATGRRSALFWLQPVLFNRCFLHRRNWKRKSILFSEGGRGLS